LFGARASNQCGPDERENRQCRSSPPPQGVKVRESTARRQKRLVAPGFALFEACLTLLAIQKPTDRPHLAAFILLSPAG
jgi:hypothetical protein